MRYSVVNRVTRSIVLIGMMGAGKSSVGLCLQRRTGLALIDTDEMVTSLLHMSIPRIFAKYGETKFREAETNALRSVPGAEQRIIVTGGGIVLRRKNVEIIKKLGVVVWLDADEETLFARASKRRNRPLLLAQNPARAFSRILNARMPLYSRIADIRVDTSVLTDQEVAIAILSKLKNANPFPGSPSPLTMP